MIEDRHISLLDLIAPCYHRLHWDIQLGLHSHYNLPGGRGSGKSSFVALEIVLGIMQDVNANAVIFRKVADTLRLSVYEQILWAIDALNVSNVWYSTTSPMQCTYLPTGQKIIFKGLDKAKKAKSTKISKGYFKFIFFEEFDEFSSEEEIRTTTQTVVRGGDSVFIFKAMNPPRSKKNWANTFIETEKLKKSSIVLKTTYLDIPSEWLGQPFIDEAEFLKQTNPKAYEHEYLGKPVGLGSEVFDNIHSVIFSDAEIATYDRIYMGIDWGWYPDPFQWVKSYYNSSTHVLKIFDEMRRWKTRNIDLWDVLKKEHKVTDYDLITADNSADDIADFHAYGSRIRKAIKGPGSVKYGVKWLQSLCRIEIDPIRCPYTLKEFNDYAYILDPLGNPTSEMPDCDNHCIPGYVMIYTENGFVPISDLVGKNGKLYSYDISARKIELDIFYDCRMTQKNAKIYRITLENGDIIEGTANHPVLTKHGYVCLKNLSLTDEIIKVG